MDILEKKIDGLAKSLESLTEVVSTKVATKSDLEKLEMRFDGLSSSTASSLKKLETKVDGTASSLKKLETKVDELIVTTNKGFQETQTDIKELGTMIYSKFDALTGRVSRLEKKVFQDSSN